MDVIAVVQVGVPTVGGVQDRHPPPLEGPDLLGADGGRGGRGHRGGPGGPRPADVLFCTFSLQVTSKYPSVAYLVTLLIAFFPLQAQHSPRSRRKPTRSTRLIFRAL